MMATTTARKSREAGDERAEVSVGHVSLGGTWSASYPTATVTPDPIAPSQTRRRAIMAG